MAESSRNAVVDNATKDSYFLMHIAPTRRKEREDDRPRGMRRRKKEKERDRKKEEEEDKETGARAEIKEKAEERDRGLNAGRKKQRLGTKVASAGETSEYGDAGADIEESRGRYRGRKVEGVCKYFSSPHGKPGASLSRLVFRAYSRPLCLSFLSLFCFLSRTFHATFSSSSLFLSPRV